MGWTVFEYDGLLIIVRGLLLLIVIVMQIGDN